MRFPRALLSLFCGSVLAICGLVFQCVFKNPMADSYVLGISSAASCSVAVSLLLPSLASGFTVPVFAITGSILTSVLLFVSNKKNTYKLLLSGIALNFFLSALTTLLIYLSKKQLDSVLFWTMGSFGNASYYEVIVLGLIAVFIGLLCINQNQTMDILLFDDSTAISSGINIYSKKIFLLIVATVGTSVCVAFCGVIGFVGLMSAHIVRLIVGPSHKKLVLPTMLLGSCIMLCSDLISKLVLRPSEIPVGIVTSIIGAPIFYIILKKRNSWT